MRYCSLSKQIEVKVLILTFIMFYNFAFIISSFYLRVVNLFVLILRVVFVVVKEKFCMSLVGVMYGVVMILVIIFVIRIIIVGGIRPYCTCLTLVLLSFPSL